MKIAGALIAAVLSAAVVLSAATGANEPGSAPIPASQMRRLGVGTEADKSDMEIEQAQQDNGMMTQGQKEMVSAMEEGKFAERRYKICLTPGPCFKKKLVCPKQCSGGGSLARIQPNHIPGSSCVFDCIKCTARC